VAELCVRHPENAAVTSRQTIVAGAALAAALALPALGQAEPAAKLAVADVPRGGGATVSPGSFTMVELQ
jgi:hypothetical protein